MEKTFRRSYQEIYVVAKRALKNLEMHIDYFDKEEGIIEATTPTSFLSWGEDIQIRITGKGSSTTVKVKSTSKAQIISWGKNEKNEERILDEMITLIN
jgi:hypothetical protein